MFKHSIRTAAALLAAIAITACGPQDGPVTSADRAVSVPDESGLLAFVNDQQNTTEAVLDVDCAIRSDSAMHIIRHRDGKPNKPVTNLFDSVDELLDVTMVGPWTVNRLAECAALRGYGNGSGDWTTVLSSEEPGTSSVSVSAFSNGTAVILNRGIIFGTSGNTVVSYFRTCDTAGCEAPVRVDGGFPQYPESTYGPDVKGVFEHEVITLPAGHPSGAKAVLGVLARYSDTYLNSQGLLYAIFLRTWDGVSFGPWHRVTPVGIVGNMSLTSDIYGKVYVAWRGSNNIHPGDVQLTTWNAATGAVGAVETVGAATQVLGFNSVRVVRAGASPDVWVTYQAPDGLFARKRHGNGTWDARIPIGAGMNSHDTTWALGTVWVVHGENDTTVQRLEGGSFVVEAEGLFPGAYFEDDNELEETYHAHPAITAGPNGSITVASARYYHYESYSNASLDLDIMTTVVRERDAGGQWAGRSMVFDAAWNNTGGSTTGTGEGVWIAGADWDTLFLVHRTAE